MKELEIILRKVLLNVFLFFKRKEKSSLLPEINAQSKVLFIRLNRIGDALVATPIIKEIKKQTGCKVYVLAAPSNYFIFNDPSLVDEIIVYNKKTNSIKNLVKKINDLNFDVVVDLHDDVSTTVSFLVTFIKCKHKVGLEKSNKKIYTHTVPRLEPSKHHIVKRMMAFTEAFRLKYNIMQTNIHYSPSLDSQTKAGKFLESNFTQQKYLVGINLSAGSSARFWGINKFKNLISSISDYDINIVIMCLERDLNYAKEISCEKYPVFFSQSFDEFSAIVKELNILFTPDTSIVHIASAFETPVFGLYVKFNTKDIIWAPFKSQFDCVITHEPTLVNISFETVKQKFIPFFEKFYYEYKTNTRL